MKLKALLKKEYLMPLAVLSVICIIVAALMGAVNMITAPKIEANREEDANAALKLVLPDGKDFKKMELNENFPEEITAAYSADGGYVFEATVKGNEPGVVVMCGVDSEGKIVGVEVIADNETPSYKAKVFPSVTGTEGAYSGKSKSDVSFYLVSGATNSSSAVYKAVKASLGAFTVATGGTLTDEPDDTPVTAPDYTTPVITRTYDEIVSLASEMYEGGAELLDMFLYDSNPSTFRGYMAFKNIRDESYVLYLATRTQYTPLETEALVKVDKYGKVLEVNLLTWTVGHGVEVTPDYLNSFIGKNKYSTGEIELVSSATATSQNLVNALESALRGMFPAVYMTDAEIEKYAKEVAPDGVTLTKMELPEDAPNTVLAMFEISGARGYVFYTATVNEYVEHYTHYDTEAFIYADVNGKIRNVLIKTWSVGHGVEITEDFINELNGKNSDTLEEVELIADATRTSNGLVMAAADALELIPEPVNYSLIAIIVIAVAAVAAAAALVYFKVIVRRKKDEE